MIPLKCAVKQVSLAVRIWTFEDQPKWKEIVIKVDSAQFSNIHDPFHIPKTKSVTVLFQVPKPPPSNFDFMF